MARTLWLLFLAAVINGTLGRRPRQGPNLIGRGYQYGSGRYARGSGGGSSQGPAGCGMATMDKCYKTLPLNASTPTNLMEEINDIKTPEMCQWFCRVIYGNKCTWFLYDKKSRE